MLSSLFISNSKVTVIMKKNALKIISFLLAFVLTFAGVINILDFKYLDSIFKVDSFYELEDNNSFSKIALKSIDADYDYIFIDCPPSLGMLTVNALSISNGIVIPMQCEFYSLEGMSQLLNTVKKIRQLYNPSLQIVGILLTMYNGRLTLTNQVVAELRKYYSELLFKVPISRTVRISEAPGYGEPICYHDPYGKGALEYAAVSKELMMRI